VAGSTDEEGFDSSCAAVGCGKDGSCVATAVADAGNPLGGGVETERVQANSSPKIPTAVHATLFHRAFMLTFWLRAESLRLAAHLPVAFPAQTRKRLPATQPGAPPAGLCHA
jgi:hypothetical protein